MYKFTITSESTRKVKILDGYTFETGNSIPQTRSFDLWDYRQAINDFDETCKFERELLQGMKSSAPHDFKRAGVIVELSLDEYDNADWCDRIEILDYYEYTCDDANRDLDKLHEEVYGNED